MIQRFPLDKLIKTIRIGVIQFITPKRRGGNLEGGLGEMRDP